jgi:hypothetical protein
MSTSTAIATLVAGNFVGFWIVFFSLIVFLSLLAWFSKPFFIIFGNDGNIK